MVDGHRVAIGEATGGGTEIRGEQGSFELADVPHERAVASIGTVAAHLCDADMTAEPTSGRVPRLTLTGTRDLLRDMLRRPDAPRERWRPVMVDATTYHHAIVAVQQRKLTAYTLLDLNLLAVAAVFFDAVIVQPERLEPGGAVAEFTHVLPIADGEHADLRSLYDDALSECERQGAFFQKAWCRLLRNDQLDLGLDADWQPHEFDEQFYRHDAQDFPTRDFAKFRRYVRLQTARAVYNDLVAGALGIPYVASSVRVAAANAMIAQRHDTLMLLRRAFAEPTHVAQETDEFAPYEPVRAPPVLGLLLERMRKHGGLDGLEAALAELREESEPLRKALRGHPDQLQWRHRPQGLFDAALPRPRSAASQRAQEATLLGMQAAAGAITGPVGAMTTRSAQAALPVDQGRDKFQKLLRPRLYILPDLAKEAAELRSLAGQVEDIWGTGLDITRLLSTLNSIRRFNADPLLSVRKY